MNECDWDTWHQLCFARLRRLQREKPNIGPILCGFMVGDHFNVIQQNFDNFVGSGGDIYMRTFFNGNTRYNKKKIRPQQILILSMHEQELIDRGATRRERTPDADHVRNCITVYNNLYHRWNGQIKKIESLNILDTKLVVDPATNLCRLVSPPENIRAFLGL